MIFSCWVGYFPSDYYKRTVGLPFIDSLLQQLNTRFSEDNRTVKFIMSLVPLVIVNLPDPDLDSLAGELHFWDKDLPSLDALKVSLSVGLHNSDLVFLTIVAPYVLVTNSRMNNYFVHDYGNR